MSSVLVRVVNAVRTGCSHSLAFKHHRSLMLPKCRIGPSVLNADLADLHAESQRLLDSGADYLHLDVMDGHFVPNLTFGHPVVKCLRNKIKEAFMETHMMVSNPDQWIEPMADAGVDQYTFHVESCPDVSATCRRVREAGMKVGVALKPKTDVSVVKEYIDLADLVLIMTVEPGFGGQKFMADMMPKVKWLRENYPTIDIEVDGGVGPSTIQECAQVLSEIGVSHDPKLVIPLIRRDPKPVVRGLHDPKSKPLTANDRAGANMIVSGTAVAKAPNPASIIKELRETVNKSLMSL